MRLGVIGLCNASMMCMAVATNLTPVYLTTFAVIYGSGTDLNSEQLGRIGAASFAGYMLGLACGIPIADRINNPRFFLMLGNALVAVSLGLMSLSTTYAMLLFSVLLLGTGAGIIELLTSPVVSTLASDHKAAAMNRLHGFYSIGAVGTIAVCSFFLWQGLSWRIVCGLIAILPLFCLAGLSMVTVPKLICGPQRTRVRHIVRNRFFIAGIVAIVLCGSAELGAVTWLSAYVEKSLGFANWVGGLSLAIFYIGMTVGRFGGSVLAVKMGPHRLLAMPAVLSIIFILVAVLSPSRWVAICGLICVGLAVSVLWPTTLGMIASRFEFGGVSMFGFVAMCGNFGGVLMPWLMGIVIGTAGYRAGFSVDIAAPLLLLMLLYVIKRFDQKSPLLTNPPKAF